MATAEQVSERNFTALERHLAVGERVHLFGPVTRRDGVLHLAPDDSSRKVLLTDRPGRILSEHFFGKAVLKLGFGGILAVGSGYGIIAMWMA